MDAHRLTPSVAASLRAAPIALALGLLLCLLLSPAALAVDDPGAISTAELATDAGRLDTASLYDLGDNTAALYAFVSSNSSFTRKLFWKSAVGAFDTDKAKLAHGDLNADGRPDALVLYDRGSGVSALYAFLSTGSAYVKTTAWKGTLTWTRAKLAVGDVNGDGADDAYILYRTGTDTAAVHAYLTTVSATQVSGVDKVVMTKKVVYPSSAYVWDKAKVAATDADGDGRDDLVSLYRSTLTTARLDVFSSSGSAVTRTRWWRGDFKAARAKLACGDLDADGRGDAFVLYDLGSATSSLRVFQSDGAAFAAPKTWWKSTAGGLDWWSTRLAAGDVTSDLQADAVLLSRKSLTECRLRVAASTGAAFAVKSWWVGAYRYGRAAVACAPAPVVVQAPICVHGSDQSQPAVSGDVVVWEDMRPGTESDVYGYDRVAALEFPICTVVYWQTRPAIDGDLVAWTDFRTGGNTPDLYSYDLESGVETPVYHGLASQKSASISGDIVVWEDSRNGNWDIYGRDVAAEITFPICTAAMSQTSPAISGDIVVWSDVRNGTYDIYGRDLSTDTEFPICTAAGQQLRPAISGDIVVWSDSRSGSTEVYGYDLSSATEFFIARATALDELEPAVWGDIVVWEDGRNVSDDGNYDIYGYDLATGKELAVCTAPGWQGQPAIAGDTVVWADGRAADLNIYGLDFRR